MAMPSFWGWADIQTWLAADLFEDFEIWVCDIHFSSGSINEGNRMADAAVNIASAITAGEAPRPDVLFGFSAAGYLAWLVDHVLGGEQRQLVVVDAAPVHRVGYRSVHRAGEIPITQLTGTGDNGTRVANMLLVCRATSPKYIIPGTDRIAWLPSDGLSAIIEVTALDHMEMNLAEIYSIIKPYVRELNSRKILPYRTLVRQKKTFGGKVKYLLDYDEFVTSDKIKGLIKTPFNPDNRIALGALLYISILHSDFLTVSDFIKSVNQSTTNFRDFLYAETCLEKIELKLRKRTKVNSQNPKFGSPQAVDAALGISSGLLTIQFLRNAIFYANLFANSSLTKRQIFNAVYSRIRLNLFKILPRSG